MEEKQPYGRAIQRSRRSRRVDGQIDRQTIKELYRLKGGKKKKKERDTERLRKRGRPQRRHYHSSLSGCKDADQTGSRQKKNRNRKEQKNRNREKDKRTNKYERAVLCLERSRHTSKTPAFKMQEHSNISIRRISTARTFSGTKEL